VGEKSRGEGVPGWDEWLPRRCWGWLQPGECTVGSIAPGRALPPALLFAVGMDPFTLNEQWQFSGYLLCLFPKEG